MLNHMELVVNRLNELRVKEENEKIEKQRKIYDELQKKEKELLDIQQKEDEFLIKFNQDLQNEKITWEAQSLLFLEKKSNEDYINDYKLEFEHACKCKDGKIEKIQDYLYVGPFRRKTIWHCKNDRCINCNYIDDGYNDFGILYYVAVICKFEFGIPICIKGKRCNMPIKFESNDMTHGCEICRYANFESYLISTQKESNFRSYDTRTGQEIIDMRNQITVDEKYKKKYDFLMKRERCNFIFNYIFNHINNIITIKKRNDEQEKLIKNIEETNNKMIKFLKNYSFNTFTQLTINNYNKNQFLTKNIYWDHWIIYINNQTNQAIYEGMPQEWISYYDEGKVPFFTKCPTCKSLTKFNYLHSTYYSPMGGCENYQSNQFNEIYCDNHYFYDTKKDKHYISDPKGIQINILDSKSILGTNKSYRCWNPTGLWREYNPKDPDGKIEEQEKKKKEAYDIEQQILQLQSKLSNLKN